MAREHAIIFEDNFEIPMHALTFEGFRRWVHSPEFPETGRIDFLDGDIEVDMSPEDLHTHGIVKVAISSKLHTLVAGRLGEVFSDRTRVVSRFAALSAEPDVVVVLWRSLQEGRVRYSDSSPINLIGFQARLLFTSFPPPSRGPSAGVISTSKEECPSSPFAMLRGGSSAACQGTLIIVLSPG